jgi:hypothetical protein
MVELIKRAVYLTDENLPTLTAQRPSAYGQEWLKPGAWGCRSEGSSDTDAPRFSPSYGECQATEKRVSGFSSLESNEVAKFFSG